MIDLSALIQAYFKEWNIISDMESYKWDAFRHFRDHYGKSYESFHQKIHKIFEKSGNLLASSKYLPWGMLLEFAHPEHGRPEKLQALFDNIYHTGRPAPENVDYFIKGTNAIMHEMADSEYGDWKGRTNLNSYQDAHAVSVYLSMFFPNDFYIYKYRIYRDFAKIVDVQINSNNPIERLFEYQKLCKEVKEELKKDSDLISFYKGWLKSNNYEDDNLNLLTQDFIYAVARHLNSETYKKIVRNKERTGKITNIEANKLKKHETFSQNTYTGVKGIDYIRIAKENSAKGFSGEMWVENFERDRLSSIGLDPDSVRHASKLDGDGIGYDILSLEDDGITPRYIEVKTTSGNESQSIYFTDNEMRFSTKHRDHYYLYRVYNFKAANKTADLTIIKGSLDEIPAETVDAAKEAADSCPTQAIEVE